MVLICRANSRQSSTGVLITADCYALECAGELIFRAVIKTAMLVLPEALIDRLSSTTVSKLEVKSVLDGS